MGTNRRTDRVTYRAAAAVKHNVKTLLYRVTYRVTNQVTYRLITHQQSDSQSARDSTTGEVLLVQKSIKSTCIKECKGARVQVSGKLCNTVEWVQCSA